MDNVRSLPPASRAICAKILEQLSAMQARLQEFLNNTAAAMEIEPDRYEFDLATMTFREKAPEDSAGGQT